MSAFSRCLSSTGTIKLPSQSNFQCKEEMLHQANKGQGIFLSRDLKLRELYFFFNLMLGMKLMADSSWLGTEQGPESLPNTHLCSHLAELGEEPPLGALLSKSPFKKLSTRGQSRLRWSLQEVAWFSQLLSAAGAGRHNSAPEETRSLNEVTSYGFRCSDFLVLGRKCWLEHCS